jgi:hypothetical protein
MVGAIQRIPAASLLRDVHGGISATQQRFWISAVVWIQCNTRANSNGNFLFLQLHGQAEGFNELVRDFARCGRVSVGKHDRKLVPAEPRYRVGGAEALA